MCNTKITDLPASLTYCCYTTLRKQVNCIRVTLATNGALCHSGVKEDCSGAWDKLWLDDLPGTTATMKRVGHMYSGS